MKPYRGLTKKRRWIYGDKVTIGERCWIVSRPELSKSDDIREIHCSIWGFVEVIRKTVGRNTGLKDKNGTEIYEGDIIQNIEHKNIWVVAWDKKHAKFGFQYTCGILIDERATLGGEIEYEVIGNIHEK